MSEVEYETEIQSYAGLVLEDQLLDHLATPEGATFIWKERLDPNVIPDSDEGIREALIFVQKFMDEHREPPAVEVLVDETGYDEFAEPVAPVEYVVERLRDRYARAELKKIVTKMARQSRDPSEAVNYGLSELGRVKLATTAVGDTITTLDLGSTLDDYEESKKARLKGISLGYEEIDMHLGGLRPKELVVVLARPKRYKSWQLVNSACQSLAEGHNSFIASMELSEGDMRDRVHAQMAGISWYRFQHKILEDWEIRELMVTKEKLAEHPAKMTIARPKIGDRNVAHLLNLAEEAEAEVMYIDQLSWFDGVKDENSWQSIGKIMEELKDATMKMPIYMAAQYNRGAAMEEGIADLAKVGLSDYIGQTADTLLGIYASRDMLQNKILHMGIVESRAFEQETWEIKINLTEESGFSCLGPVRSED